MKQNFAIGANLYSFFDSIKKKTKARI